MKDKLNVAQKGYDLLMLLAISDKHYHEKEAQKILEFIKRHYHVKTLHATSLTYFEELSEEKRLEELIKCAEAFEHSTQENKNLMIEFVFGVIFADRKFASQEKSRFKILERFWDFNLKSYIDKMEEERGR